MIFYDFEVFRYDWLVVLIDLNARKETVIINDPDKLKRFYEEHKGVIWAGYNSRNYDQYILKAILCGFDPKPVNDWIIAEAKPGYRYSSLFREYPLINYDVMPTPPISLKALEALEVDDGRDEEAENKPTSAGNVAVSGGDAYIRTGPGTQYDAMGIARAGDKLEFANPDSWVPVLVDGRIGWISGKYATIAG